MPFADAMLESRLPGRVLGFLAVALAATSLLAAPGASKTRGLRVDVRTSEMPGAPVAETVDLYSSSHALVIGIDRYRRGWPRLRMAVRDAREVAKEFARRGFDVTFRTNLNAVELRETLREFFAIKGADPEARLVLWFAGHGHSIDREGYLV